MADESLFGGDLPDSGKTYQCQHRRCIFAGCGQARQLADTLRWTTRSHVETEYACTVLTHTQGPLSGQVSVLGCDFCHVLYRWPLAAGWPGQPNREGEGN